MMTINHKFNFLIFYVNFKLYFIRSFILMNMVSDWSKHYHVIVIKNLVFFFANFRPKNDE